MERKLPVWLFLLTVLVMAAGAVILAAFAAATANGEARASPIRQLAFDISQTPKMVRDALTELRERLTGEFYEGRLRVPRRHADLEGFAPVRTASGETPLPGLMVRHDSARAARGWRLMTGAVLEEGRGQNVAVLLAPDMTVASVRRLDEIPVDGFQPREPFSKMVHGVSWLQDGSIVVAFDGGVSLQRFSACGDRIWSIGGRYHHAVTETEDQRSVWTMRHDEIEGVVNEALLESMVRVDVETGRILEEFTVQDIIDANPMTDVFEIMLVHQSYSGDNARNTSAGVWNDDPFHFNDIDPLPESLAAAFPMFAPGDLLLSARTLNLVAVVDPATKALKWWRMGEVQRQHDPDWEPDGWISVFNNRMSRDFSEITALNPATFERRQLVNGAAVDFYSRVQGKHDTLPNGHVAVASSQQSWGFEVDASGAVVFELLNAKVGDPNSGYVMTNLMWLPEEALDPKEVTCVR